jgi:hypothetical protein
VRDQSLADGSTAGHKLLASLIASNLGLKLSNASEDGPAIISRGLVGACLRIWLACSRVDLRALPISFKVSQPFVKVKGREEPNDANPMQ